MESRTQGSRPRPRTQTKFEAKNSSSENRPSQGQRQECLRPRLKTKNTGGKCSTKKKGLQIFFRRSKKKQQQSLHSHFSANRQKKLKTKTSAKDQGHRCKCSARKKVCKKFFRWSKKKKKSLQPHFSADRQKKRSSRTFFKWSTNF